MAAKIGTRTKEPQLDTKYMRKLRMPAKLSADALEALERIRVARDYHALQGEYPECYGIGDDQCFDDWAADIAEAVLLQVPGYKAVALDTEAP